MKMKTSEMQGYALDWAVAKCEGFTEYNPTTGKMLPPRKEYGLVELCAYNYSTDWAQGGPIIERELIEVGRQGPEWIACIDPADGDWETNGQYGPTPLVAAMRCYVASKLGEEVEVPDARA